MFPSVSQKQNKTKQNKKTTRPQTPLHLSHDNAAGPWPACVGKSFVWCATRIQQANVLYAAHSPMQLLRIKPNHPHDERYNIHQHNRVLIHVNEHDIVTYVPRRG